MCRPATNEHNVMGVERISPAGPHNQLQNIAPTTIESGDNPVA